mmetsp:Transcript_28985/g.64832  ORF Transcript_28985/g.64832 Transcript_28985/m.64832 type:complete len:386 (-) Transcript_28985:583-1740(-)
MTDWRPVYDAATLNDVDALHRLEADDHSLIQSDPVEGCTPLFSACWHGCSEAVSFILHNHDGGSSVNMATVHGATPAYAAALRGEAAILKLLHVAGADLSTPDNEGATPLHAAVYHRHTETVEYLLSCYDVTSKINVSHAGNITVLWVAVQRGDEQLISALKEQGASFGHMPSEKTRGFTPPDHRPPPTLGAMALQQRRTATVSSNDSQSSGGGSLGGGARQVKSEAVSGKAAVFRAAALGDIDELLNMAALGENMDTADNFGRTPLRVACEENHPKCVKFLIARGSNKEARDAATGSTPCTFPTLTWTPPELSKPRDPVPPSQCMWRRVRGTRRRCSPFSRAGRTRGRSARATGPRRSGSPATADTRAQSQPCSNGRRKQSTLT